MLAHQVEFAPDHDLEVFASIPAAPAVFLLAGEDATAEPYATKTANLRRRLQRLLGAPEVAEDGSLRPSKRLNLRDRVRRIEYTCTGSDFESGFLLYRLFRSAFPETYARRLRLRPAPLVKLHLENEFPRASVTTRMSRRGRSVYYGPFWSRVAAEKFMNDALDFFKMRRCVEDLHPDPQFPGCIYSEMKMCLAPCYRGCTVEEHSAEVERVQEFFDSAGESLRHELEASREQASARLEFESAAALHARLDKLAPVMAQAPKIVRRIDRLNGVLVQPSAERGAVALFRVDAGCLAGPIAFPIQPPDRTRSQPVSHSSVSHSMESRLEQALSDVPAAKPASALEAMEHLALLKRWYYRGRKTGELFLAGDRGELPMRRLVRGVGRVYRGESDPEAAAASQQLQALPSEIAESEISQPEIAESATGTEVSQPKIGQSAISSSGVTQPGVSQSEIALSAISRSEVAQPDIGPSAINPSQVSHSEASESEISSSNSSEHSGEKPIEHPIDHP